MSKYFRVEGALGPGGTIEGPEVEHRFVRVLRAKVGEVFTVCDAEDRLWRARVSSLAPLVLVVEGPAAAPDRNPRGELEVWVPWLKGGRTEDLVRQLTELGATRIVAYGSRYSVVRLEPARAAEKLQRLVAIAREAGNQCGRTRLPEVAVSPTLPATGPGAFLWEGGGAPARDVLAGGVPRILVGPEGGLHEDEAAGLVVAGWSAATLGSRILRAETAVVAFAVLALAAGGELP